MPAAFIEAMRLIGLELDARACNNRLVLARIARRAPITGHAITGWQPAPA